MQVPLDLLRAGIKLSALLPKQATQAVNDQGLDLASLSELDADELMEALAEFEVTIEGGDGDKVHIFCE